ncbi:MAG: hypothetical protein ACXWLM_03010 [Myxococcales bacterium]
MRRWLSFSFHLAAQAFLLAMDAVGRLPGARYPRFITLADRSRRALRRGKTEQARRLARELLALAPHYESDWNTGNAIHPGHTILGEAALSAGTSGSPQLNSFGPTMRLARALLRAGDRSAVLEYLALCGRFWELHEGNLLRWRSDVEANREPDFGPNLRY